MNKKLVIMAISLLTLLTGTAFAGGPGKKMGPGCPEACQKQIDDLNSSQAQQNEQLSTHGKQLKNHEGRITTLEKNAYDPWYARVGLKAAWMNQDILNTGADTGNRNFDTDMGWGGALAFGRQFGMFRTEVEIAYQSADLDERTIGGIRIDGENSLTTVMLNGYYEIPVYDAFSVYFMAGLGYAKYDVDVVRNGVHFAPGSGSDNAFAYKAGAGVTYNFTSEIAGDLGYEYMGVADNDLANDINGHNIVASMRFKF
jgi:opacity protein-like surface antigen